MFSISSPAFEAGQAIPARYTCSGQDVSPPLAWSGAPSATKAFVLIVDDPDANGFVHWVVVDLPPSTADLAEDASRTMTAVQSQTSWGSGGWRGPCPPSGTHHYVFTLSALDGRSGLSASATAAQVRAAISGHVLAQATLTGTFRR